MLSERTYRAAQSAAQDDNTYLASFSDIMAGLLFVFVIVLIGVMLLVGSDREQLHEARKKLLLDVQQELANKYSIKVEITDDDSVIQIPEDTLCFVQGKWEIPSNQRDNVEKIGEILEQVLARHKDTVSRDLDTIFVEGHTDAITANIILIDPRDKSKHVVDNWRLSAFRGISIWQFWTDKPGGRNFRNLLNRENKPLFSVSGYAETRPFESEDPKLYQGEDLKQQQQKNRRIDLRFAMRPPTFGIAISP